MISRLVLAAAIGASLLAACGDRTPAADVASPVPAPAAASADVEGAVAAGALDAAANDADASAAMPSSVSSRAPQPPVAGDAGAWRYESEGTGDAQRHEASLEGRVDGNAPVTLTFASNALTGRQAHLQGLPEAPDCAAGCRIQLSIDGVAGDTARATPAPDDPTTLTLRDARGIWRSLEGARRLEARYPGVDGRERHAVFEVAGVNTARMPGWGR
jgi:hypothetical protein